MYSSDGRGQITLENCKEKLINCKHCEKLITLNIKASAEFGGKL
jgi:hypothetical protein